MKALGSRSELAGMQRVITVSSCRVPLQACNPFSILIIVPTIVAASSLPIIYLIILGLMTLISISFLSVKYFPIIDSSGEILKSPEILLFGFSVSLIITVTFLGSYVRKIFLDNSL